MVQYIPRLNATLALSFALVIGACSTKTDNNAAADSALNKDIQLANRDTAAQPALTDVPASSTAPAPAATTPTTTDAQVTKVKNQPKGKDVQKVIGGAAIGAIAGQILGRSTKATVIGGAVGAAAGAGAAAATANYEGCVNSGGRITATLNSSTQVNI